MNTFDQKNFLDVHIPYRLGNLDACFHALRILNSEPRTHSVTLRFDTGHEMRGRVALVTNAWVETGIITCRTMLDFLEGKTGKGHKDDITICSFSRQDGQHLAPVLREKSWLPARTMYHLNTPVELFVLRIGQQIRPLHI